MMALKDVLNGLGAQFKKRRVRSVFATGILIVIGVALIWLLRTGPIAVSLAEVKREDLSARISASAKVAPPTRDLNFALPGRLAQVSVAEGDVVVEGQLLARLDTTSLELQQRQAEANLTGTEMAVQLAESGVEDARLGVQVAELNLAKALGVPRAADQAVLREAIDQTAANLSSAEKSLANVRVLTSKVEAQAQDGLDGATQGLTDARTLADQALDIAEQALDDAEENKDNADDYVDEVEDLVDAGESGFNQATLVQAEMQADQAAAAVRQAELRVDLTEATNDQTINSVEAARNQAALALETIKATNQQNLDAAQGLVNGAKETKEQAEAQLNQLMAKPRAEDIDLARAQVSQAKNGFTASETQLEQVRAQEDAAAGTVELSEQALKDASMVAPVSGRIGAIEGEIGEFVLPPTPGLPGKPFLTLVDVQKVEIETEVDDDDISKIKIGQEATVTLDAFPTQGLLGKVVEIPFTASTNTVGDTVFKAKVEMEIPGEVALRLGMEGEAEIDGLSESALVVPDNAVLIDQERPHVFTVSAGVATKQRVKLGARSQGVYEILEGLSEGDKIVAEASSNLEDGSRLAISE